MSLPKVGTDAGIVWANRQVATLIPITTCTHRCNILPIGRRYHFQTSMRPTATGYANMSQMETRSFRFRYLVIGFLCAWACSAQLPEFYTRVDRVIWVVENIDRVRPAWEALGLSDIREYPNIQLVGEFRGKPVTIYAWQITGRFGNLVVDMIQPAEGQANAYTDFLAKRGDGILSIVHEVSSRQVLEQEILRMKAKRIGVLQQVTVQCDQLPVTYTYFDTQREGKFALGLVNGACRTRVSARAGNVSHFGFVIWDMAAASAYWERLGFPPFSVQHATPRPDGLHKGNPVSLTFDVGFQQHAQFRYEWISPPANPQNIYADFLKKHHSEGVQHIGVLIEDLAKSIVGFEKLGYHVDQSGAWGDVGKPGSGQYAYLDTYSAGGIRLELIRSW